jgi:uncharacterized protein (TIGR00369 family)
MHFNQFLGMRLAEEHEDGVTVELPLRPEFQNGYGMLHGGVTAFLADAALGVALQRKLGQRQAATVELKINYLRPPQGDTLRARSRFVKMGRTLCVGQVEIHDAEQRLVAVALMTYMIFSE